jgi:hypothetical protein
VALPWRNSPLVRMTPSTAAITMAKPVAVVTDDRPDAVAIGATRRPALTASSDANRAVTAAAMSSSP